MTVQDPQQAGAAPSPSPVDRTDRREGLAWCALGAAVLAMSLSMDRLANQGVDLYAAPGLLPALLGIVMILFGSAVALRREAVAVSAEEAAERRYRLQPGRLAVVIGLCLTYSIVLIGHGLPFWLASALFVSVAILVLQHPQRKEAGQRLGVRAVGFAVLVGLCAGSAAMFVFQNFFLVHLP